MKKKFTYSTLFLFLLVGTSHAQVKFVNEFLNIGVGARAQGMAGSVVANVKDGTAGYWNTAGMTDINMPFQINAMHAEWFGGISNYDYFSLTKRFNKENSSYGSISFIRLGVDDIPNTLNLIGPDGSINYDKITNFSASDYAFFLSYASKIGTSKKLSLGGNIKIIRRVIGPFANAWGFGADFSLKYKINEHFTFGGSGRDITTTFNAWSFNLDEESKEVFIKTNNEIPNSSVESTLPRVITGIAYHNNWKKWSFLFELDTNISSDARKSAILSGKNFIVEPSFGLEVGYFERVFLRAGIGNIQNSVDENNPQSNSTDFQPNVGMGIKLGRLQIDYALANVGNVSGVLASHIFSLTLNFNERKEIVSEN